MRSIVALSLILLLGQVAHGDGPPRPIPDKVVTAWREEGVQYGHMPATLNVGSRVSDPFQEKPVDAAGQLPALRVNYKERPNPKGGLPLRETSDLTRVPVPEVPFALSAGEWTAGGRHRQLARFTTVELLDCSCSRLVDPDLADLAPLKNLRVLNLSLTPVSWHVPNALIVFPKLIDLSLYSTQFSDSTAELIVARLPNLQALDLGGGPLHDFGLTLLSKHKALRHLHVAETKITDDGLRDLIALDLRTLNVGRTAVTDAGLKHVGRMKNLESLQLYGTAITDQGVAELARLDKLRQLNLHVTGGIGPDGLASVCQLKGLEDLVLRLDAKVGEKNLLGLAALTKLRHLHVTQPTLDEARVGRLRKALPGCTITWSRRD